MSIFLKSIHPFCERIFRSFAIWSAFVCHVKSIHLYSKYVNVQNFHDSKKSIFLINPWIELDSVILVTFIISSWAPKFKFNDRTNLTIELTELINSRHCSCFKKHIVRIFRIGCEKWGLKIVKFNMIISKGNFVLISAKSSNSCNENCVLWASMVTVTCHI